MVLVRARLSENLDSSVAQFVVFGRKRILIDADLANRRLRRKLAAGESVDVDLAAVGPGRRSGQRLQVLLQLIGIVRERFKVLAGENDGTGIASGVDVDLRCFFLDVDLFFLNTDL